MQTNSVFVSPTCWSPNPTLVSSFPNSVVHSPTPIEAKNTRKSTISQCSKHGDKRETQFRIHLQTTNSPAKNLSDDNKALVLERMYSFLGRTNKKKKQPLEPSQDEENENNSRSLSLGGISSNMWWAKAKSMLSQRFNLEGIMSTVVVVVRDRNLALPHLTVPDIRWIHWAELKNRGFQGVVFDKDNTLTCPYSLSVWPPLASSLDECKSVFGRNVVVFSNSAGLCQYDANGAKARELEKAIGVHVIRHGVKKPAGTGEDIEKYFGCAPSELVMVGDRHFTDIVYGNRNGFLTILTEPFSLTQEPFIVKQVRKLEASLVNYWYRKGLKPSSHNLLPETKQCVKGPSL